MHPGVIAASSPDRPAVVMHGSERSVTYGELDSRSTRLAHAFRAMGLQPGGRVAILMPNHERYFEVAWAAQRSGLYYVPINHHLRAEEISYVVGDCDAKVLVVHAHLVKAVKTAELQGLDHVVVVDDVRTPATLPDGWLSYPAVLDSFPADPLPDEQEGAWMFYSSGTTGRPKGIRPGDIGAPMGTTSPLDLILRGRFGYDKHVRYLVPAPLYHAAPLGWAMSAHRVGGTVVVMARFDPEACLDAIERHRITHAQFVPTHLVRLLKLPEGMRRRADVSSLEVVVHAAAPCPQDVKEAVIRWFGPIVTEFYSGSEGVGFCMITSEEWLEHKGSVGRPVVGVPHILDPDGIELPVGVVGQVWFETPVSFEYHNAPDKNAQAWNEKGWATFGDLGRLDEEGYLYLADRRTDLVISGGVNIYPREVEDVATFHEHVADIACIGVPDDDLGQVLIACVQLTVAGARDAGATLADLDEFVRARLAGFKCPRRWIVVDEMPRLPTGKLLKRELVARYG